MRAVRPPGAKASSFKPYSEADSIDIARQIVAMKLLSPPWFAKSASWMAFIEKVARA
ncbi:hypothetical protein [Plantactinospora sp. CA-290183]|uniref:hypothetical protein n=1 Tax=Plantactinospora sp. CA-290183 TaxID=3240006 RepID=UPI003D929F3B